ncbi:MAG: GNAT family N-acetyltransferase [Lachnospiraceae bacterium]|nr:GNAT family N-acetyltransferase [Lachnospiraceae bacterium]
MEIVRATDKDIPGIHRLLSQVEEVHRKGRPDIFRLNARKYSDEELGELLADGSFVIFVCHGEEGEVLAHAFCQIKDIRGDAVLIDRKTLYIDDICVEETARGRGIGRAVFDFVMDYAGKEGFYNVTLNVWECNPGAKAFYECMGMKIQKYGMEMILQ